VIDRTAVALGAALASASAGCFDTDAAVFVEPSIEEPSLAVQSSGLAGGVDGSFRLRLHLGPRASAEGEVSLGQFSLSDESRATTLHSPLAVLANPTFPVVVPVDSDVVVALTFVADDNALTLQALDELCSAGAVVIGGALDDSLRGGGVTVASQAISPAGCP
jgi:hypothetical protein